MKDKCGVVAIASRKRVAEALYTSLLALQHRGQEAAGIAVYEDGIKSYKGIGLVKEAFEGVDLSSIEGNSGIGHVYYSIKISVPENAQPSVFKTSFGDIAIAHNGIIVNAEDIKLELMEKGHYFTQGSEEESFAYIIADALKNRRIENAMKYAVKKLQGSYSFAIMINNRVFGLRDPYGIRPLSLGKIDEGYIIASESVAIDALGGELIRDVMPGELVELKPDGYQSYIMAREKYAAHCFFEFVYFARSDSIIEGREVYRVRQKLGEILARESPVDADVIVPVPDSGRTYAYGFSKMTKIPVEEGLMKNRYIARTFIMPSRRERQKSVMVKLNPVKSVVEGKKIVVIDDSIVRGTTMRKIVDMLRKKGAKEVHVRIASPPIIAPCYFGIDMTSRDQLIASNKNIEEIRREINADSLAYISIEGLTEAIGISRNNLCLGCVSGEYPVRIKGEKMRFQENIEKWK